jgi:hypothetical protein
MKAIAGWKKRNYGRASISLLAGLDHLDYLDWPGWVLQLDVGDRVRLSVFNRPESLVDPASVREVWLSSDTFYNDLREWRDTFMAEWESLPKHSRQEQATTLKTPPNGSTSESTDYGKRFTHL